MPRGTQRTYRSQQQQQQPTQSQRPTQGRRSSQNQSQIQSRSQRRQVVEEDESDEEEGGYEDEDEGERDHEGEAELKRQIAALVRLAIFNENKRSPLRREDIQKRVLGENKRAFKTVMDGAQTVLREVFGMQLVEIMSRAEREKGLDNADEAREERTVGRKKATVASSKQYILRSTLSRELIKKATVGDDDTPDQDILEAETDMLGHGNDEEDENAPRSYGSILSWNASDQLGAIGITYVILSLILASGGVLTDPELKRHLRILRLTPLTPLPFTNQSPLKSVTMETFLAMLVKQGFLDKTWSNTGPPRATQGKRARPTANLDEEQQASVEWHWGSRAHSEIGEKGLGEFMCEFIVGREIHNQESGSEDSDEPQPTQTQRRNRNNAGRQRKNKKNDKEKMLEGVMKGLTRAAGGTLHSIR